MFGAKFVKQTFREASDGVKAQPGVTPWRDLAFPLLGDRTLPGSLFGGPQLERGLQKEL
jgi:hypothetical protein